MTKEYQEISNNDVVNFENKGDSISGILKEIGKGNFENNKYVIETEDKEMKTIFGTAMLDSKMSNIQIGADIKIEYDGSGTNKKGQTLKLFRVFLANNPNTTEEQVN